MEILKLNRKKGRKQKRKRLNLCNLVNIKIASTRWPFSGIGVQQSDFRTHIHTPHQNFYYECANTKTGNFAEIP